MWDTKTLYDIFLQLHYLKIEKSLNNYAQSMDN